MRGKVIQIEAGKMFFASLGSEHWWLGQQPNFANPSFSQPEHRLEWCQPRKNKGIPRSAFFVPGFPPFLFVVTSCSRYFFEDALGPKCSSHRYEEAEINKAEPKSSCWRIQQIQSKDEENQHVTDCWLRTKYLSQQVVGTFFQQRCGSPLGRIHLKNWNILHILSTYKLFAI